MALVYHQMRVEKPRKEGFLRLPVEKRYSLLSKYTCILIGFASVMRHMNSIALLAVEGSAVLSNVSKLESNPAAEIACDVLPPTGNVALTIGGGLVFLFLWFRQRVFYVHASLKVLNNKYLKAVSFAVIIVWIMAWIALFIAYFVKVRYQFDNKIGCLFGAGTDLPYAQVIFAWTGLSILMQIALLALFVYPILKRTLWKDQQKNNRNTSLMRRVKKAIYLASVCLGTDIFSVVVLVLVYQENTNSAIFMYSVNLVINHLATIACFDNWKKMLWPWSVKFRKTKNFHESVEQETPSVSLSSPQQQSMSTVVTEHNSATEL